MIKGLVMGAAIASSLGGIDAISAEQQGPTMVSEKSSPATLVLEEASFSFNADAEYNIPNGFTLDLSNGKIKNDFVEKWKLERDIKRRDFVHGFEDGFPKYGEVDSLEDVKVRANEYLDEVEGILKKNVTSSFEIYEKGLEGLFKDNKLSEYSNIERGDGIRKYTFNIVADADVNSDAVFVNNFIYSDGSVFNIKYGGYGFGKINSSIDIVANVDWDREKLKAGFDADAKYRTDSSIGKGWFVEAVRRKNGLSFGVGKIMEDIENKTSLDSYAIGFNANLLGLNVGHFIGRSKFKEESEEEKDITYVVAGFDSDKFWALSNVGKRKSRKIGSDYTHSNEKRFSLNLGGSEKIDDSLNVLNKIDEKNEDTVYAISVGSQILDSKNFNIGIHGYSNNLVSEDPVFGASFRSDYLNAISQGDNYFGAVKFFGNGGSFKNDFRGRIKDKGSFVGKYGYKNLWKGKHGLYGVVERKDDEKKVGMAICLDDLCFVGGVSEKKGKKGYFAEFDSETVSINGNYLKDGINEKCNVGVKLDITKYLSVSGAGNLSNGDVEGSIRFNFPF